MSEDTNYLPYVYCLIYEKKKKFCDFCFKEYILNQNKILLIPYFKGSQKFAHVQFVVACITAVEFAKKMMQFTNLSVKILVRFLKNLILDFYKITC